MVQWVCRTERCKACARELKDKTGHRLALADKVTPMTCLSVERARLPAARMTCGWKSAARMAE